MVKRMLIDDTQPEETRVVIVDGNKIEDVEFESTSRKQIKGNIYLAKVMRIEPSLQAAFVDYGGNRHGFLAFGEIHPDYYNVSNALVAEVDKEVDDIIEAKKQYLKEKEAERERIRAEKAKRREERLKAMAEAEALKNAESAETLNNEQNDVETAEKVEAVNAENNENEKALPENVVSEGDTTAQSEQDVQAPAFEEQSDAAVSVEDATQSGESGENGENGESGAQAAHSDEGVNESVRENDNEESSALVEEDVVVAQETPTKPKRRFRRKKFSAPKEELKVLAEASKKDETVSGEPEFESNDEAVVQEVASEEKESYNDETASVESEVISSGAGDDDEVSAKGVQNNDSDADDDDDDMENDFELQRKLLRVRKLYHRCTIQDVIKEGQVLLVQVVKEERGNKGAALTTYLSLAGRYCVLMPNRIKSGGVSRKITSVADRKRLKGIVKELPLTMDMSMIVRTAGEDKTKADIVRDYNYLIRTWNNIRLSALKTKAPALIHEEGNLIKRALRDMFTRDMTEVIVDGDNAYKTAREFIKMLAPQNLKKIKSNRKNDLPLFQRFQVEAQLDKLHDTNVQLESGGYLVINPTEALVSIDVNSGRATKEKDLEETALKTNLEAADEIARQLRMRDLAGLIVVDFIDMEDPKNNAAIEKRMKEAMKNDRSRVQIAKMSCFGLLEISRQRTHSSFFESNYKVCPFCHGKGLIRTIESSCVLILRSIEEEGIKNRASVVNVFVPSDVAIYILNNKRDALIDLEKRYKIQIIISADNEMKCVDDFRIERIKASKAVPQKQEKPVSEEIFEEIDDDDDDNNADEENGESFASDEETAASDETTGLEDDKAEQTDNRRFDKRSRRMRNNRFDKRGRRRGRRDSRYRNNEENNGDNSVVEHSEPIMLYNSHEDIPSSEGTNDDASPKEEKKSAWWRKLIS